MSELRADTLTRPGTRLFLFAVPPSWAAQSACSEVDPELFFASDGERAASKHGRTRVSAAKAVCNGCTVRAECLTYALTTRQRDGVWGGLTETERLPLEAPRKDRRP